MRLDDVRGFVFDVDGTLVRRFPDGVHPLPGAVEVLDAIRASGRKLAIFTNGSHLAARGVRRASCAPTGCRCPTRRWSRRCAARCRTCAGATSGAPVLLFAQPSVRALLMDEGVDVVDGEDAEVVLVLHVDDADFPALERAARAILGGARLLTANYLPVVRRARTARSSAAARW